MAHGFSAAFIPQVASELDGLVNRVVLIGGELPDDGRSVYDRLSPWQKLMTRVFKAAEKGILYPEPILRGILCNGLDRESTRLVLDGLVPEPLAPWWLPGGHPWRVSGSIPGYPPPTPSSSGTRP